MTSIQLDNFVRDLTARGTLEIKVVLGGKSFYAWFTPHGKPAIVYERSTVYLAIEALWLAVVTNSEPPAAS